MKTNNQTGYIRAGADSLRRMLGGVGLLAGLALPAADSGNTAKDYTMFVGDHLAVHDATGPKPVIGAADDALIVRQKDSTRRVSLRGIRGLRFERGVKLSNTSADVGNVKVSFTNQAANQAWFRAASVQSALHDHASDIDSRASGEMRMVTTFTGPQAARAIAAAEAKMLAGMNEASTISGVAQSYGEEVTRDTALADADTVKISFELSSPEPLGKGYVALITEFKGDGQDGAVQRGISVKEFDRLDTTPKQFALRQAVPSGGVALSSYRIAVFADGQEVATNLSERRVAVTKDEAHQFFLMQYLLTNKGQTRGPSMIPLLPKPQLKAAAQGVDLPKEVFVKVDKNGTLLSLSTDKSGGSPVTPEARAFLDNVRFLPALNDGTPIEGSARIAMADVLR